MMISKKHNPPKTYYEHVRMDVVEFVVKGKHKVLDVGCGAGALGQYLMQQGYATEVIGLELMPEVASVARGKLTKAICCNLNTTPISELTSEMGGDFDTIICADVLEHLIDPWSVLEGLVTQLKLQGHLIISLPNIRHWSVIFPLVFRDKWTYQEEGILDRTHLKFFTRSSMIALVEGAGLKVKHCSPNIWGRYVSVIHAITLGLFEGIFAGQYIVVAVRSDTNG